MKRGIENYPTALETSSIVPTKLTATFPQAPERFLYNLAFPMAYMALSAADHNATKKLVVSADEFCFAHSADKPRKTITLRTDTARWFRKCGRQHTRGNGSGLDCGKIAPGVKLESVALVPLPPAALKQSERLRRFRLRFLRQRQQMARFTPHRPSSSWTPVASEARSFDRCNVHRIGVYSPCIASNEDQKLSFPVR